VMQLATTSNKGTGKSPGGSPTSTQMPRLSRLGGLVLSCGLRTYRLPSDASEDQTVDDGGAAKAATAMNATSYFACSMKPGDDLTFKINDFRMFVYLDAAHDIMYFRPDSRGMEWRFDDRPSVFEYAFTELDIILRGHVAVKCLDRSFQDFGVDLEIFGQGVETIKLLYRAGFERMLQAPQ